MRRRAWILLGILVVLVPLGLLSPYSAWGEWEPEHYRQLLGYIPDGIANARGLKGAMPDYSVPFLGSVGGYYLSALVGIALLGGIYYLLSRWVKRS